MCFFLSELKHIRMRDALIKFRLEISDLKRHKLRYRKDFNISSKCPFCAEEESELHFLFVCAKYDELRHKYMPSKFYRRPSLFRFSVIMSDSKSTVTRDLAYFIYRAMELRSRNI